MFRATNLAIYFTQQQCQYVPFYAIIKPLLHKTLQDFVNILLMDVLVAVLSIRFIGAHFCINERAHNICRLQQRNAANKHQYGC